VPPVMVYFGWPATAYARVDLPDPLGPMMAWVSPELMVRSTPRRISFSPVSVSTVTCRSRISRVVIWLSPREGSVGQGDEHVLALDLHGVYGNGLGGRQAGGLAGVHIEARAVQPALDGLAVQVSLGEGD